MSNWTHLVDGLLSGTGSVGCVTSSLDDPAPVPLSSLVQGQSDDDASANLPDPMGHDGTGEAAR